MQCVRYTVIQPIEDQLCAVTFTVVTRYGPRDGSRAVTRTPSGDRNTSENQRARELEKSSNDD